MIKVDAFKAIVAVIVMTFVMGCSNTNSPVSVSSGSDKTSTVAAIGDMQIQDVASAGSNILWSMGWDGPGQPGNFYVYKYNYSSNSWSNTYHWGNCIAVTSTGICYHANTLNQVWWGDGNGNFGQISISGTNLTSISDIGAANSNSYDWVWITGMSSNGSRKIWRSNIIVNGNSRTPALWKEGTVPTFTPKTIACDPYDGYKAISVDNYGYVWYTDDSGMSWHQQTNGPSYSNFAAIRGNKAVISAGTTPPVIYKGTVSTNGGSFTNTNLICYPYPVAASSTSSFYYIGDSYHCTLGSF